MKHKRFSEEQIIGVLKEHEAGGRVDELCRRHAISTATFYTWRKKYAGMEASDAKRRQGSYFPRFLEPRRTSGAKSPLLWRSGI